MLTTPVNYTAKYYGITKSPPDPIYDIIREVKDLIHKDEYIFKTNTLIAKIVINTTILYLYGDYDYIYLNAKFEDKNGNSITQTIYHWLSCYPFKGMYKKDFEHMLIEKFQIFKQKHPSLFHKNNNI